jgi:hypothetical protein
MNTLITREQLAVAAPSIFAHHRCEETTTARYNFVPTIQLVDLLADQGWYPTRVQEQKVRNHDRSGYQKHLIRFRSVNGINKVFGVDDLIPELCLTTSHDGTAAFVFCAGIFRLVCMNGLVVAMGGLEFRVKHFGYDPETIINGCLAIKEGFPMVADKVNEMKAIQLSRPEQVAFAEAASVLRWDDKDREGVYRPPVMPERLISPARSEDQSADLFTTYNVIQERLLKGGQSGRTATNRRMKSRPIKGISEDVKLNKALWVLTEKLAELKGKDAGELKSLAAELKETVSQ